MIKIQNKETRYLLTGLPEIIKKEDIDAIFQQKALTTFFKVNNITFGFVDFQDDKLMEEILIYGLEADGKNIVFHKYNPIVHDVLLKESIEEKKQKIGNLLKNLKKSYKKVNTVKILGRLNGIKKAIKYPKDPKFSEIISNLKNQEKIKIKRTKLKKK